MGIQSFKSHIGIVTCTLLCSLLISDISMGQYGSSLLPGIRAKRAEVYGGIQMLAGDTASKRFLDIELDDTIVYGFGVGYHIDEHFCLNTDLMFGATDIEANYDTDIYSGDTDLVVWNVNLDYNILEEQFTPFVTGGLGWMNFKGDYDYYSADFNETDFSYNFGAGVRWDDAKNFFIKAMYRWIFTDLTGMDDPIVFDGFGIYIGFVF